MMNKKIFLQYSIPGMMRLWYMLPLILFITSCSKSTESSDEGSGNISLHIGGLEAYTAVEDLNKTAAVGKTNEGLYDNLVSYAGFDAITDFETFAPVEELADKLAPLEKQASLGSGLHKEKLRANTPTSSAIADTVRYRLILYNKANVAAGPVYNEQLAVGDRPDIQLPIGQEYIWVAYSLNKGGTVPNIVNNTIPQAALANQDFLFRKGEIKIQTGINYLDVIFQRWTTKFDVEIDVRGMFARIDPSTKFNLKANSNLVSYSSDFDVLNERYTGTAVASAISVPSSITGTFSGAVKTVSFYSAPVASTNASLAANTLQVAFPTLALKMDDETTIRTFTNQTVNLTHGPLTLSRGRYYKISSILVESAIQVVSGGAKWARSNLWYNESAEVDNKADTRYRFRVNPHVRIATANTSGLYPPIDDSKELWRFNTLVPNGATQVNGFDPCSEVHPKGLWKMPSIANFEALPTPSAAGIIDKGESPGWFIASVKYYESLVKWDNLLTVSVADNSGYNAPYRVEAPYSTMHDLYFTGVGYYSRLDNLYSRPNLTKVVDLGIVNVLPILEGGGYYWTSEGINPSSVNKSPTYFRFGLTDATLAGVDLGAIAQLSLIKFVTFNFNKSVSSNALTGALNDLVTQNNWQSRLNIRCVRAN